MSQNMNFEGSRSYLSIPPSNHRSNATISYRDGNPVLSFHVGEQNRMLLPHTLRLVGNLSIYKTSTADGFGNIPLNTQDLNISPKLGTFGMIDQIVLSSQKSKNVIEHVRHYSRYLASYFPQVSSKSESIGHLGVTTGMIPNVNCQRLSYVSNVNGSDPTNRKFRGNSFCIHLPTGLLNQKTAPIPLSGEGYGIGGLSVDIHLSSDQAFLNGSWTDAFYQLTDVSLECEVINPTSSELSRLSNLSSGTLEYNAISSYYTTIQSSNAIINLRLGLSRVIGIFMNFIPSTYLNNISFDSNQTTPLINDLATSEIAPIKQVVFQRGGEKVGFLYNLNTNVRDLSTSKIADPNLTRQAMNTFTNFNDIKRTQLSPITNNRVGFSNMSDFADGGAMFNVGYNFDGISAQGLDFRNQNFSAQLETGLTTGNAHSAFIFVRSKQTLVFNQNGLQVIT